MDALKIYIHKAEGVRYADANNKKSDPYAEITFPKNAAIFSDIQDIKAPHTWRTKVISERLNPTWEETVTVLINGSVKKIPIHIWDADAIGRDDLGTVDIEIKRDEPFVPHDEWYEIQGKGQEGKLHVVYQIVSFEQAALLSASSDEVQQKLNETLTKCTSLEGELALAKAEHDDAQADLEEANKEIEELEAANEALAASEAALKEALEGATAEGDDDAAKISQLSAQIANLKSENATLAGQVNKLTADNAKMEEEMDSKFQIGGKEAARKAKNQATKEAKKIGKNIKKLF